MLEGLAMFFHAISNPVPWSGEVLMIGNPTVTFTPVSKASILNGNLMNGWMVKAANPKVILIKLGQLGLIFSLMNV